MGTDVRRDDWLAMSDEALHRACEEDFYRASGPGGQKRNKTESAVRLRHIPTGLMVVATESRSREENRQRALRRIRSAIALRLREPVDDTCLATALTSLIAEGLQLGVKHPQFLASAAALLDLLDHHHAKLSIVAERISQPTAQLVRFLKQSDELWEQTQHLRSKYDLPLLK
jgi:hypothetical protein